MGKNITYGDLEKYFDDLWELNRKDYTNRQVRTALKRLSQLDEFPGTTITDENTEFFLELFNETATDLKESTRKNYSQSLRLAVNKYIGYVETTGKTQLNGESAAAITYAGLGEYLDAYRAENPKDITATQWLRAFSAMHKRVPGIDQMMLTPEHTERILVEFANAESDASTPVKASTATSYRNRFRKAAEHYCSVIGLPYPKLSVRERRELHAEQQETVDASIEEFEEEPEEPQESFDAAGDAEGTEDTGEELIEYQFLLRPNMITSVFLPQNLTAAEAARISQWVSSFVLEP